MQQNVHLRLQQAIRSAVKEKPRDASHHSDT